MGWLVVMVGVGFEVVMADDQVMVDPEFNSRPGRVRGLRLVSVAGVVVAAFLFGWLMGSGTSSESDSGEVAPSMIAAPSIETTSTAVTSTMEPPSATGPPTSTSTTEPPDPLSRGLLSAEDLRAVSSGLSWEAGPADDASWDKTVAVLTVPFCVDPTLMLSESHWRIGATSPLTELDDRPTFVVFQSGSAMVQEVLYTGDETMVAAAFDALVAELEVCLDTYDPTFLWDPEYVEDGWHTIADRYEMPPVGDESYAFQSSPADRDGAATWGWWNIRFAVVRSADRIVIVNSIQGDTDEPLNDSDFNEIVQIAVDRLWAASRPPWRG